MKEPSRQCILALDLGTSAFKAAWVDDCGSMGPVTSVQYRIHRDLVHATCPPERYFRAALRALREAAASAEKDGRKPAAIGVTSQAQTFVTLDPAGKTVGPAVVWLDERAEKEAKEADL